MLTTDIYALDLMEGYVPSDPSVRFQATFALHNGLGSTDSAAVFIQLEPGGALAEHTDSPEEVLLVLDGEVEFRVGDEIATGSAGTLAVVPPMVPHGFRNTGETTARVIGFFPQPMVVSEFVEPIQPMGVQTLVHGQEPAGVRTW